MLLLAVAAVFVQSLSLVWLIATPWTIQSMEFSRPEYWSGQSFPSPGDLPSPGIEPGSYIKTYASLKENKPKYPYMEPQIWVGI